MFISLAASTRRSHEAHSMLLVDAEVVLLQADGIGDQGAATVEHLFSRLVVGHFARVMCGTRQASRNWHNKLGDIADVYTGTADSNVGHVFGCMMDWECTYLFNRRRLSHGE